jgi:hypothetical protein
MAIRKLTALLIKIISFFLFLKGVLHFSLSAISTGIYIFSSTRPENPFDLWGAVSMLIWSIGALLLPILFIVKADWLAARIANDDEKVVFPERWFHRDVLLVGIFLMGLYIVVDGVTGIANILASGMRFAPEGWRPRFFAPVIRILLGALFVCTPQTVLKITGQGAREE